MDTTFNRFEFTTLLSLGYLATTCLWRKTWTVCKLKDLQHVISDKWHDAASDSQIQKSSIVVGKPSSSSGKGEWRIYSALFADQLLMIRPGYERQRKWWTACTNWFMACNAILFVSRPIQKCFGWKFLHIFVDFWSLHKCFCVDSFSTIRLNNACKCSGRFFAPPGIISPVNGVPYVS